jgi:hypothetical protein
MPHTGSSISASPGTLIEGVPPRSVLERMLQATQDACRALERAIVANARDHVADFAKAMAEHEQAMETVRGLRRQLAQLIPAEAK